MTRFAERENYARYVEDFSDENWKPFGEPEKRKRAMLPRSIWQPIGCVVLALLTFWGAVVLALKAL